MNGYCINAINIANKYLPPKKLSHSMRVVQYALEDYDFYEYPTLGETAYEDIFITALLHDVVEDTKCTFEELKGFIPEYCLYTLKNLTKDEEEDYIDYIKRLANGGDVLSFVIKRADMKDHLSLEDTLTDKLKNKYFPALKYLL